MTTADAAEALERLGTTLFNALATVSRGTHIAVTLPTEVRRALYCADLVDCVRRPQLTKLGQRRLDVLTAMSCSASLASIRWTFPGLGGRQTDDH